MEARQLLLPLDEERRVAKRVAVLPAENKRDAWSFMRDGMLVSVTVRMWRAKTMNTAEDLGLEPDKVTKDMLGYGLKKMLPPNLSSRVSKVESRARRALYRHSYQTPCGRFVPWTALESWGAARDRCESDIAAIRDEIVGQYEEVYAQLKEEYAKAAVQAYKRMSRRGAKDCIKVPPEYIEGYLRRVLVGFPGKQKIMDSYGLEMRVYFLPSQDYIERQLGIDVLKAEGPDVVNETDRALEEVRIRALKKVVDEQKKEYGRIKAVFAEEGLGIFKKQLYRKILTRAHSILLSIDANTGKSGRGRKRPVVVGKATVALGRLVGDFFLLDFIGDDIAMRKRMERLGVFLEEDVKTRDANSAVRLLLETEQAARAVVGSYGDDVGEEPRYQNIEGVAR